MKTTRKFIRSRSFAAWLCGASLSLVAFSSEPSTLKDAFAGQFLVGGTLNGRILANPEHKSLDLASEQFACITSANALKWGVFNPEPGVYRFEGPDRFVEFGENNGIALIGHVLFWHSQTPSWVYEDDEGNPLTRDALLARMRERARMLAERYGEKIKIWDVVNEAVNDDGSLRKSKFNEIIGDDFIEQAFRIAADEFPSDTVLIYNDYGMTSPERRDTVVAIVNDLKAKGVRVDGIGMQGHWSMDQPSVESIEDSIVAFSSTGAKIHITEFDIDYLGRDAFFGANVDAQTRVATPENNPYPDGNFPLEADQELADRYEEIFAALLKHSDQIDRVTFWGVTDADSWLNNWPVRRRTNYTLLFKRDGTPKLAFERIVKLAENK